MEIRIRPPIEAHERAHGSRRPGPRSHPRPLRLLVIAPFPLYPVEAGGKVRIVKLARGLAAHGIEITVLAPFHFRRPPREAQRETFRYLEVKYPFLLPYLLTDRGLPYGFLVSLHPGYRSLVSRRLEGYDLYWITHAAFADLLSPLRKLGKPILYGAADVDSDYVLSECASRWARKRVEVRLRRLEASLATKSDHVTVCCAEDRQRLIDLYGSATRSITVIPNGIDEPHLTATPWPRSASRLEHELRAFPLRALFSGSDVAHNREAVEFVLNRLAPTLADDVAFIIHGGCARSVSGRSGRNVFIDATPGDFSHHAGSAVVGLNPVLEGSGTSLKTLQYLAHGLPVISTPFGVRGFDDLRAHVQVHERRDFAIALRRISPRSSIPPERLKPYAWSRISRRLADLCFELTERRMQPRISA